MYALSGRMPGMHAGWSNIRRTRMSLADDMNCATSAAMIS
jgi:hypothetical protein